MNKTMAWRRHPRSVVCVLVLLAAPVLAQSGKAPSVSMVPVGLVTTQRTKQTMGNLVFAWRPGFTFIRNKPNPKFLFPLGWKWVPQPNIAREKMFNRPGMRFLF